MAEKQEKPKLTDEIRQKVIDENMHLVPKETLEGKWNTWDIKKRYTMIRNYINKQDKTPKNVKTVLKSIDKNKLNYDELEVLVEKVKALQYKKLAPVIEDLKKEQREREEKIKELESKLSNN